MKGKVFRSLVGLLIIPWIVIFFTSPVPAQEESSCIKCHTSTKTLIELTRALEAKKKVKKSAETEGEG